jgi:SAM-dependent methyltransferase
MTPLDTATNRRILQDQAYPDSTNLRSRAGIYAWQRPYHDLIGMVVDQAAVEPGMSVLDVGCGPGAYLARLHATEPRLRLIGLDLSPGMAKEAVAHAPAAVADVCRLPVAAASVDRVLAPHMLYHAPDLELAVGELGRVVRPDGLVVVVTNGSDHLGGFTRLIRDAVGIHDWARNFSRFDLDRGEALLRGRFEVVRRTDIEAELVVDEVEPVVRYVASMRSTLEPQLESPLTWADAVARIEAAVRDTIAADGVWRSPTHSGILVCR